MYKLTNNYDIYNSTYTYSSDFSELLKKARYHQQPETYKDWLVPSKSWTITRDSDGVKLSGWERSEN